MSSSRNRAPPQQISRTHPHSHPHQLPRNNPYDRPFDLEHERERELVFERGRDLDRGREPTPLRFPPPHHPHPMPPHLEERMLTQQRDTQALLIDNQRFAATHVALKQEVQSRNHEIERMRGVIREAEAEKERELREVYERFYKLEAEVREMEVMKVELARVRNDVVMLTNARNELVMQVEGLGMEIAKGTAEAQQIPVLKAEIETWQQELHRARSAIEYEKKGYAENYEQGQAMEKNLIMMAREVEKLRAEVANAEKRARAAAVVANPGTNYSGNYANPESGYGGNPYPSDSGYGGNPYPSGYGTIPVQSGVEVAPQYGAGLGVSQYGAGAGPSISQYGPGAGPSVSQYVPGAGPAVSQYGPGGGSAASQYGPGGGLAASQYGPGGGLAASQYVPGGSSAASQYGPGAGPAVPQYGVGTWGTYEMQQPHGH